MSEDTKNWKGCTGRQLRAMLQKAGITQEAAASLVGVAPRTMRRWIAGESNVTYAHWYTLKKKLAAYSEPK